MQNANRLKSTLYFLLVLSHPATPAEGKGRHTMNNLTISVEGDASHYFVAGAAEGKVGGRMEVKFRAELENGEPRQQ